MFYSKTAVRAIIVSLFFIISASGVFALTSNWQKGLTLRLTDQNKSEVDQSLEWMVNDYANFLTITPGWLTDSKTSSNVDRKSRTPSDELLAYTIDKAHSLGMQVMLKPHLDIKGGSWRANLDPADKKTFFENYSIMILHYAELAQTHGVEQLAVGAELYSLTTNPDNEQSWRDLISKVRAGYEGKLTYSANSNSQDYDEGGLPFWDMLDYVGLSMYYPLADNKNPTVSSLFEWWNKIEQSYVYPLQQKLGKPIIASEVGYRGVDGAAMVPENYSYDAEVDLAEQAYLYRAFFEFWKDKNYFRGVHFWDWEIGQAVGGANDKGYTVQNKPAEDVLKYYFSSKSHELGLDQNTNSAAGLIKNPIASNSQKLNTDTIGFNKKIYADRNYVLRSFPAFLEAAEFIKTKNDDKNVSADDYLKFELSQAASVYVAYDYRADSLPEWLAIWQPTGYLIDTSDTKFNLYRMEFRAGPVSLGGNNGWPAKSPGSNYFVIAIETQNSSANPLSNPESVPQSSIKGKIIIDYPKNNSVVSGEKKIKMYLETLEPNDFTATYNVDNRGEKNMVDGSSGIYKQAKVQFDNWTWNRSGPYHVVITARDLEDKIIDQASLTLFVKQ